MRRTENHADEMTNARPKFETSFCSVKNQTHKTYDTHAHKSNWFLKIKARLNQPYVNHNSLLWIQGQVQHDKGF